MDSFIDHISASIKSFYIYFILGRSSRVSWCMQMSEKNFQELVLSFYPVVLGLNAGCRPQSQAPFLLALSKASILMHDILDYSWQGIILVA